VEPDFRPVADNARVTAESTPHEPLRDEFDVPPDVAYFNTANMSPLPHRVRAAGEAALERRARPWTIQASDWFDDVERVRALFARLIDADVDGVAVVPASSYGFGVAARNLRLAPWQRIVVLAEEYPSGIYTWRALANEMGCDIVTIEREPGQTWTDAIFAVLDEQAGLVSVPNVHWTDGALIDIDAVAARVHELGCRFAIDASQSCGVMPISVERLRPDFLVTVAYKWLLGPFSTSLLYVAPEHRDGEPLEENWINRAGSEDFARLVDYTDAYQPGARRFDTGQRSNFQLAPMTAAALEAVLEWEPARIAATLTLTTEAIAEGAAEVGLEPVPAGERGPHLLGVRLPDPAGGEALTEALNAAGCFAAVRGDSLRISPHLHNTPDEVERLVAALGEAVA
jgi:selenocysteine lyase/cysteine desulfurase